MDAALAGLIGAAIGVSGTITSSMINTGHTRRQRHQERQDAAYTMGVRALSEILFHGPYDNPEDKLKNEQRMASEAALAWNQIMVVGSPDAAVKFFLAMTQVINHKEKQTPLDLSVWGEFHKLARRDLGARRQWWWHISKVKLKHSALIPRRWRLVNGARIPRQSDPWICKGDELRIAEQPGPAE